MEAQFLRRTAGRISSSTYANLNMTSKEEILMACIRESDRVGDGEIDPK